MSDRVRAGGRRRDAALALEVWSTYAHVRRELRRAALPALVDELRRPPEQLAPPSAVADLSAAVIRRLSVGRRRPTCLVCALVLFRLLRRRGQEAELVIGLPPEAVTHDAHAWVEVAGADVGPAPGRNGHLPLARFG